MLGRAGAGRYYSRGAVALEAGPCPRSDDADGEKSGEHLHPPAPPPEAPAAAEDSFEGAAQRHLEVICLLRLLPVIRALASSARRPRSPAKSPVLGEAARSSRPIGRSSRGDSGMAQQYRPCPNFNVKPDAKVYDPKGNLIDTAGVG